MRNRFYTTAYAGGMAAFLFISGRTAALEVVSTTPPASALNQSVHTVVSMTFDQPLRVNSITEAPHRFFAYGRWSGPTVGTLAFSNGHRTITLVPDHPFFAGETVMVVLSDAVKSRSGSSIQPGGYSFSFWTHARRAPLNFHVIDTLNCRAAGEHTQAYGGVAADLNHDGFSDLTIVQEVTADLRVFMNTADGSGHFEPFLQPTYPVGNRASPSETGDFNGDGNVDICVANIDDNNISILFGNGDGTFTPHQTITVAAAPRGIAVLDFDGDGDLDIANTNANGSNVSLMTNLGGGNFSAPAFFEGGGASEWSLAAADMDHDGIMDLVVGAAGTASQRMIVQRGHGNGTFTLASSTPCGGRTWMIAVGDVNGDGNEDVVSANGFTPNAAVMLGNGAGGLGAAQIYPVGIFPLATDLGDLDGDGDLDWTVSSYSAGEWRIFLNDGAGHFSVLETVDAPSAGSCTVVHDFDNDGDNDLSLIDEISDVVVLYENSGKAIPDDFDGDGQVALDDFAQFRACMRSASLSPDCEVFDADADRDVDFADFAPFQRAFTAGR